MLSLVRSFSNCSFNVAEARAVIIFYSSNKNNDFALSYNGSSAKAKLLFYF